MHLGARFDENFQVFDEIENNTNLLPIFLAERRDKLVVPLANAMSGRLDIAVVVLVLEERVLDVLVLAEVRLGQVCVSKSS